MPYGATDVNAYVRNPKDPWQATKAAHDEVMDCYELQDHIARGNQLFGMIRLFDTDWSRAIQTGRAKFDPNMVREIRGYYEWWIQPCSMVESRIRKMQDSGHTVDGAEDFRENWVVAKKLLRASLDELLVPVTDK